MDSSWRPKLGDRVFRPRRIKHLHLRRVMGVPALFSIGYGDVGSSIYYGLGVVALVAVGATPIALGIAGLIYVFNALTYAEGSAMLPEGGGSASFARNAFNDLIGFISGWVLMLSYVATVAISAYTIPPYLAYFWPILKDPVMGTAVSIGVVFLLMLINIFGIQESSRLNIFFIFIDILTQLTLIVLGVVLIMIPNPGILAEHMFGEGNWPSAQNLLFGVALAALCFTGVESISQHGEETRQPEKKIPRAYIWMIVVVLVLFGGISLLAMSAMTPQALGDPINGWARDPIAGIAHAVSGYINPVEIAGRMTSGKELTIVLVWVIAAIRDMLPVLVAILAATIMVVATNAGLLGISRLTYNLATHRQLPATLSTIHGRFRTPYVTIMLFCLVSMLMLVPGFFAPNFFTDLGALYVFGSLLCFAIAHLSVIGLRVKRPDMPRPFKLWGHIKVRGRELPVISILGLIGTSAIWIVIIVIQPFSRWVGILWMLAGLAIYYFYRRRHHLSLTHLDKK